MCYFGGPYYLVHWTMHVLILYHLILSEQESKENTTKKFSVFSGWGLDNNAIYEQMDGLHGKDYSGFRGPKYIGCQASWKTPTLFFPLNSLLCTKTNLLFCRKWYSTFEHQSLQRFFYFHTLNRLDCFESTMNTHFGAVFHNWIVAIFCSRIYVTIFSFIYFIATYNLFYYYFLSFWTNSKLIGTFLKYVFRIQWVFEYNWFNAKENTDSKIYGH